MTKARNLADLLNADGQIDNADIADNTIANAKLAQTPNFRNIIINGDMSIAQRATSSSGITSDGYYTVDRFLVDCDSQGTWTMLQSTDVPSGQGFTTSLKMDCTTADAAPAASDKLTIQHRVEGQNLQYLKKGTANAQSLTASFWVKSNKTGTYICELFDVDNLRSISKAYTIDASNTWEKKTITFAGDTTGAFDNDNGVSFALDFFLGAGSNFTSGTLQTSWGSSVEANRAPGQVNLADNTANNFWITGVQLEAGTTASDFEFLPYDVNLQRCQRYYYEPPPCNIYTMGITGFYIIENLNFPVEMRATPTMTETFAATSAVVADQNVTPRDKRGYLFYSNFTSGGAATSRNVASDITADAEL